MSLELKTVRLAVPSDSVRNVPDGTSRQTWAEKGYPFAGMIRIRFHGSGTAAPLSAMTSTAPRTTASMDLSPVPAKRKVSADPVHPSGCLSDQFAGNTGPNIVGQTLPGSLLGQVAGTNRWVSKDTKNRPT